MSCKPVDPACNNPDAVSLAEQLFPNDYLVSSHRGKGFCQNVSASQQMLAAKIIQSLIDAGWRNYWGMGDGKPLPPIREPSNPTPPDWWRGATITKINTKDN